MADESQEPQPTQLTRPQGKDEDGDPHKPIEIPVPKREDFENVLRRATGGRAKPKD